MLDSPIFSGSFPGQIFSGTGSFPGPDELTPIENSQARKSMPVKIPADRVGRDNMFHSWEAGFLD